MSYASPDQPQNPALNSHQEALVQVVRDVFGFESSSVEVEKDVDLDDLGRNANYVGREKTTSPAIASPQEKRRRLFRLQKGAAKLLDYNERVANCRWTVQRNDEPVQVHLHPSGGEKSGSYAAYHGLQTCASVWHCPICARKISEVRRKELNTLLKWAQEQDYKVLMMTLTTRHDWDDELSDQLDRLKQAKRKLRQRRDWKKIKASGVIIGTVTATEVTYGERSGWHTHFHELVIMDVERQKDGLQIMERLRQPWVTCLRAVGLDGLAERAFQIQGASAAGTYVSKWGAAEELSLSGAKQAKGKGRNPLQLLADAVEHGDDFAGHLWKEFAVAFKGRRQLVWSNGLRDLAEVEEVTDEEAAEEGQSELMGLIDHTTWTDGGARFRRVLILEEAENTRDPGAVFSMVHNHRMHDPETVVTPKPEVLLEPEPKGPPDVLDDGDDLQLGRWAP